MILSYGIAYATAWRTFGLLKGGLVTFMPTYHIEFSIGTLDSLILSVFTNSWKSFGGRSNEMSASPRSSSARRLPAEGTSRRITRRIFGSGPDFQSSLRVKTISWPGFQDSTLNAPPPAVLALVQLRPHGSSGVACFFTSSELRIDGTGTARSGIVILSLRTKLMRKV